MKAYSQDLRERVIELYNTGLYTRKEIARILKLARDTVGAWIKRYISTGDFSSKQHCQTGRVRRFDNKEQVLQYLSKNPDATALEMRDSIAPGIPDSTFYDSLVRMKITYKKRAEIQRASGKRSWNIYAAAREN